MTFWGTPRSARAGFEEAIAHFEQALRVKPDYAEAHYHLGNAFCTGGTFSDAIGHYEEALRLRPDFAEAHSVWGSLCIRPASAKRPSITTSRPCGSGPISPRRTTIWEMPS